MSSQNSQRSEEEEEEKEGKARRENKHEMNTLCESSHAPSATSSPGSARRPRLGRGATRARPGPASRPGVRPRPPRPRRGRALWESFPSRTCVAQTESSFVQQKAQAEGREGERSSTSGSSACSRSLQGRLEISVDFSLFFPGQLQIEDGRALSGTHVTPRQQAPAERGVRDDGEAELARDAQDPGFLDVEREERVLDLHGRDGVHGVRASDRLRRAFGEADVSDFSGSVCQCEGKERAEVKKAKK